MLNIVIVDDCAKDRYLLSNFIKTWANERSIDVRVSEYESGDAVLSQEKEAFLGTDAVFLDISMTGTDGLETAQIICQMYPELPKIFYSSLMEYVYKGYMVNAVRFIVKTAPDLREQVYECMGHIFALHGEKCEQQHEIITKFGERVVLRYSEVICITAAKNYTEIHMRERQILQRKSMRVLTNELPPQFVRCSRSAFVNVRHVRKIVRNTLVLSNGETLQIGDSYFSAFMEDYLKMQ